MGRKKKNQPSSSNQTLSTLVENPFGIHTPEILEAQNTQEELILDGELQDEELREELEAQLQDLLDQEAELEEQDTQDQDTLEDDSDDSLLVDEDPLLEEDQEEQDDQDSLDEDLDDNEEEENPVEQDDPFSDKDHLLKEKRGDSEHSELEEPSEEETQAQLAKIVLALSEQTSQNLEALTSLIPESQDHILEAQIAEDLALQQVQEEERMSEQAHYDLEFTKDGSASEIEMNQDELQSCIEALLFISDKPLSREKLKTLLGPTYEMGLFDLALDALQTRYQSTHHGIELVQIGGGYQFRTKPGRADLARKLVRTQTQRLSSGCMETLAIVAYRQPVMKEDIDQVRGVDSSYFIRGLLEKKLVRISGRSELPGRPLLYETTPDFLELFSLNDLSSLPSLREIEQMIPTSQSQNPDDDPKTRELRRLVGEMKADQSTTLVYNPKEDDKILKEFKDQISAIPSSTPYLEELRAAELEAKEQEKLKKLGQNTTEPPLLHSETLAAEQSLPPEPAV